MPAYRVIAADLLTGALKDEVPFSTFKFSHILNRSGAFNATIGMRHPKATRATLDPGRTALHVERDGVIVWSGILWTASASVTNNTLTIGGEGWWSYFHHRFIRLYLNFPQQDQLYIAQYLINYAQGIAGGNVGIVVGAETSGVLRDRTWNAYERKNVGTEMEQLAAVENGFDFGIDCSYVAGAVQKTFTLSYPRRGVRTQLVFALGANLEEMSQQIDATRCANLVDAAGAGAAEAMLISTAVDTSQLTSYPLLEDVVSYHNVSVSGTLYGLALTELRNRSLPVEMLPSVLTHSGPDTQVGSYRVGDTVAVTGQTGYVSVNSYQRIMSYEVSVDAEGRERVAIAMVPDGST